MTFNENDHWICRFFGGKRFISTRLCGIFFHQQYHVLLNRIFKHQTVWEKNNSTNIWPNGIIFHLHLDFPEIRRNPLLNHHLGWNVSANLFFIKVFTLSPFGSELNEAWPGWSIGVLRYKPPLAVLHILAANDGSNYWAMVSAESKQLVQLIYHYLRGFVYPIIYEVGLHPRWLFGISSINSIIHL